MLQKVDLKKGNKIYKACAYFELQAFIDAYAEILNKTNNPERGKNEHKRNCKKI